MTTFLWVLAAIGAAVFAWVLATSLGRAAGGHHSAPVDLAQESGKSRYELDNERPFNAAAFFTVALVIGVLVALVLILEYA